MDDPNEASNSKKSLEEVVAIFKPLEPISDSLLDIVQANLPHDIRNAITHSATYTLKLRITSIATTCSNFPDGPTILGEVIEKVRADRLSHESSTGNNLVNELIEEIRAARKEQIERDSREREEKAARNKKNQRLIYATLIALPILAIIIGFIVNQVWFEPPRRLREEANAVPMVSFDKGGNALLNRLDVTGKVVTYPISVKPFALDKQEVSNQNYRKCVEASVCKAVFRNKIGENWYNDMQSRFDHPVVGLDGVAANTYCKWLNKRLPTEAEWDFAAQGDASAPRDWPWGNDAPTPGLANLKFSDGSDETLTLVRITDFEQGELKFNSLVGNAYELTSTRAEVDYATYNADSPSQLHVWDGRPPDKSFLLIARGLSFTTDMLSSPRPDITLPVEIQVDNSTRSTSFRCAKP
jgi:formylglycine-generating enzyme required for sulfatase activity